MLGAHDAWELSHLVPHIKARRGLEWGLVFLDTPGSERTSLTDPGTVQVEDSSQARAVVWDSGQCFFQLLDGRPCKTL